MNINITARKFKAHNTLKDHIESELSSLEKFNGDILKADVILSYRNGTKSIKKAEVVVSVPGQKLDAADESDEFVKSVTSAVNKMERQLRKLKTKRTAVRNVKN